MDFFARELKQAARRLRAAPMFTFVAVATLAAGIGANTAIFSVLEGVLLKPLPYPQSDRLIAVRLTAPGIHLEDCSLAPSTYFTFLENNRSFEGFGVYTGDSVTVTGKAEPERVRSLLVSYGTLPALGVRPLIGRLFRASDDRGDSPRTTVLHYGYWQQHFGGDPGVLGRRMMIDGEATEVIGVLPRDFQFLDRDDDALIQPLRFDRNKTTLGNYSYDGVARLKPGVTLAQARADGARMLPIEFRSFPPPPGFSAALFDGARIAPRFLWFKQSLVGDIAPMLWVLMGTISIVLLIACANVANLMLVRVEGRHTELTIRTALGASQARIAYELLVESILLATVGGLTGVGLAFGALRVLKAVSPAGIPRLSEIGIDGTVVFFAVVISLATGLAFGLVPVLKYGGKRLALALREGGRSLSQSRERHRARNVLVVVEVALALMLLISSGLMIRTFHAMTSVAPGFTEPANVQTFSVSIPDTMVKNERETLRLEESLREALLRVPGVRSAGISSSLPMGNNDSNDLLYVRDRNYRAGELPPIRRFVFVSPEARQAMGTKLIAGRDFTWNDTENLRHVAMISENFAKEYWGSAENALHKQVREGMNDDWREIVGVMEDVRLKGVDQDAPTAVYFPLYMDNFWNNKQFVQRYVSFVVRSPRAGSQNFLREIKQAIWGVNQGLPLANVRTMDELYRKSMARTSFTLVLLVTAASMALVLGSIGIYGVIAYSVSQRAKEIGIRMALGAQQGSVTGMFVRDGVTLAGTGAVVGLVGALFVMRWLQSLLFGVKPVDPLTYGAMFTFLVTIAALASYLPSRRAAGIDPATALRND